MESRKIGWTKKRKYKKRYYIYHFYFRLNYQCWWSIHYKIKGNKRIKPERLILRSTKREDINYFPYELSSDLMTGWIEVTKKKFNKIMKTLEKREEDRKSKLNY